MGVLVGLQAIPQFTIGHLDVSNMAKTALSDGGFGGLILAGNYMWRSLGQMRRGSLLLT